MQTPLFMPVFPFRYDATYGYYYFFGKAGDTRLSVGSPTFLEPGVCDPSSGTSAPMLSVRQIERADDPAHSNNGENFEQVSSDRMRSLQKSLSLHRTHGVEEPLRFKRRCSLMQNENYIS